MLPANVILTNRLINSSEAKDNSKVTQLAWHIWENMREILSRAGRVRSQFHYHAALSECLLASSHQGDGFLKCLCLLTLGWTCSLPVNICLLKISPQKWLYVCVCVCLCLAFFFLFSLHLLDSSSTHAPSFDSVLHDTVLWHLTFWPHSQTAITTPQSPAWTAI